MVKNREGFLDVQLGKDFGSYKTIWDNKKYDANEYGSKLVNNYLPDNDFDFPKSIWNVYDCLYAGVANRNKATILDFFAGSGTTADAVIRLNKNDKGNRRFILVEMGDHFMNVILPRLKKLSISLNYKKGVPQDRDGNSLFFKYYDLEQYEQTLRNMRYNKEQSLFTSGDEVFEQYIFFGDEKLAFEDVVNEKKGKININFDKLYKNIDWPETLSNLLGKPIKKIKSDSVVLQDGKEDLEIRYDFDKMNDNEKIEFLQLIKPLIWWGRQYV